MELGVCKIIEEVLKRNENRVLKKDKYNKIIMFIHENIKMKIDNHIIKVKANNYAVVSKNKEIELIGNEIAKKATYCIIYVMDEDLEKLGDRALDLKFCFRDAEKRQKYLVAGKEVVTMTINLMIKRSLSEEVIEGFGKTMYIQSLLNIICIVANRGYIDNTKDERTLDDLDIVDSIIIYIEQHLSEKIKLEDLEKTFYLNKFYICKKFKKRTGETIYKYIIKRKLGLAKELIGRNMPIKDVYYSCGFENYSNFFRAFKNEFNMTPRQYYKLTIDEKILIEQYLKMKKN